LLDTTQEREDRTGKQVDTEELLAAQRMEIYFLIACGPHKAKFTLQPAAIELSRRFGLPGFHGSI
jgi:hypothetical protein